MSCRSRSLSHPNLEANHNNSPASSLVFENFRALGAELGRKAQQIKQLSSGFRLALSIVSDGVPRWVAERNLEDHMKTKNAALSLASLSVLTLMLGNGVFADQPPDNVEGNWTIYSTGLKNGETVLKHVQIAQYGNRITGYFEGPDQSGPIQGEVNGHHIEFNTVTRTVIHFRGQIYGNNISGLYGIKGQHAPWQAVRPATAAVAPTPPANGIVYTSQPVLTPPVPAPAVAYSLPPAPAGAVSGGTSADCAELKPGASAVVAGSTERLSRADCSVSGFAGGASAGGSHVP